MRWIKFCSAVLAAMSIASVSDAAQCTTSCGAAKSCGCAATTQPACCKPVIVRPCCPTIHTYQRRCSDIKPPCCDSCCHNGGCSPSNCGNAGGPSGCGNGGAPACAAPAAACAPACAAPAAACAPACAAPAAACAPAAAPACAAPAAACAPACAAPAAACAPACAAPATACAPAGLGCAPGCAAPAAACGPATSCTPSCAPACGSLCGGGFLKGLFAKHNCASTCAPGCAAPATACAPTCAAPVETRCCNANPCDIAKLIYISQTACYARQRRAALRKLGNRYDCICNPEIMTAFVYGLNDADERVRRTAADKIGDQIRKNCCCCPEIVAALTCALGDCDRGVRRQAEQALRLCGYDIVDGCCGTTCSTTACGAGGCAPAASAPAVEPSAPAPVPPQEKTGSYRKGHLSNLLGMRI